MDLSAWQSGRASNPRQPIKSVLVGQWGAYQLSFLSNPPTSQHQNLPAARWTQHKDANTSRVSKGRKSADSLVGAPAHLLSSCDACRRRKICCVREPNDPACSLCRMQKTDCQYQSKPNPRRRREKTTSPTDVTQDKDPLISSTKGADPVKAPEWIYQFVGLSGDQDPFVLRHCLFDGSNHYRRPDWACYRVKNDLSNEIPLHFSVRTLAPFPPINMLATVTYLMADLTVGGSRSAS